MLKKNANKNAKIRDIKMSKTIPLLLETMQCPIIRPWNNFPGPCSWSNSAGKGQGFFFKNMQKLISFWVFVFAVPKHNRLTSGELLSNDGEQLDLSVASHCLLRLALAWFDSATFSFLALLVNKSKNWYFKKLQIIAKFKKKLVYFPVKIFKFIYCLCIMTRNPSARLEKLHGPVMIVKLRKGQKIQTFWKQSKILTKSS